MQHDAPPLAAPGTAAAGRSWWRHELLMPAIVFTALAGFFAVTSEGFLTGDALTHYLFAKHAIAEPHYLVNVWGRPFCTALYALPAAAAGRVGVRACSVLLALACASVTYRLAREQGLRWPGLAFVLTLGQPLLFLHSFSEMTELPFATLVAFALWAYQRQRFVLAILLAGLSPLARPEGFAFVALGLGAAVFHRRLALLPLAVLPLVLWNFAGSVVAGTGGPAWRWLIDNWPYAATSMYPSGSAFQFLALLPVVVSPLVVPATLIGIWRALRGGIEAWRSRGHGVQYIAQSSADSKLGKALFAEASSEESERTRDERHLQLCRTLTALIPLMILSVHSLLYATGKLGSFGEARYMLVAAPFWGLLSARGWEWAWQRLGIEREPIRWAAAAVLAPLPVAIILGALPIRPSDDLGTARKAVNWYTTFEDRNEYPFIASTHPGVYYYLGISPTDPARTRDMTRAIVAQKPPGTLLIWDPLYGPRNATGARAMDLDDLFDAGWVFVGAADIPLNGKPPGAEDAVASRRWNVFRSPEPIERRDR